MARKRVKLAYIIDAAARKAAYRKIKKGLAKKLSELTTLCGTETCAVIYSPTCDYQPEVWPSAAGAQHLFSEFKALPDIERSRLAECEGGGFGRAGKIKIAYITNAAARKATCKKRKKGLMKKLSELTTLCGIEACAVLYPPPGCVSQPEAWPSAAVAHRLLSEYKNLPEFQNVKEEDLDELRLLIEQNLKDINNRVHALINAHVLWGKQEY
ncbi:hypothetical protein F3Y22_tig00111402pilonHSYRG00051 [Hibiscus syriacus]|uniref:MADS-box domain-containing protein n=1 Tax=Hibiscus syriacus TaxID=106335 RepID=A0A6A2XQ87_HIBSY|nr:hypothetical protein F3Y22_tig00111402pilonHSYRG00051 [Hibiscus syriacus]